MDRAEERELEHRALAKFAAYFKKRLEVRSREQELDQLRKRLDEARDTQRDLAEDLRELAVDLDRPLTMVRGGMLMRLVPPDTDRNVRVVEWRIDAREDSSNPRGYERVPREATLDRDSHIRLL